VALAELGPEAFQQPGLLPGELDLAFGGRLVEPQQALVLVSRPWRCHTPRTPPAETWMPLDAQLLLNSDRPVAGMHKGVVEDCRFAALAEKERSLIAATHP